jgi:hypothetical protein
METARGAKFRSNLSYDSFEEIRRRDARNLR